MIVHRFRRPTSVIPVSAECAQRLMSETDNKSPLPGSCERRRQGNAHPRRGHARRVPRRATHPASLIQSRRARPLPKRRARRADLPFREGWGRPCAVNGPALRIARVPRCRLAVTRGAVPEHLRHTSTDSHRVADHKVCTHTKPRGGWPSNTRAPGNPNAPLCPEMSETGSARSCMTASPKYWRACPCWSPAWQRVCPQTRSRCATNSRGFNNSSLSRSRAAGPLRTP